jgi:hypothetical protein
MARNRNRSGGRSAFKIIFGTLLVATAVGATKSSLPRRAVVRTIESGRAWSKRQLDAALQAPVIKSQGERWRAMHRVSR